MTNETTCGLDFHINTRILIEGKVTISLYGIIWINVFRERELTFSRMQSHKMLFWMKQWSCSRSSAAWGEEMKLSVSNEVTSGHNPILDFSFSKIWSRYNFLLFIWECGLQNFFQRLAQMIIDLSYNESMFSFLSLTLIDRWFLESEVRMSVSVFLRASTVFIFNL